MFSFQANATFDALGRLRELVDLWDELGPRVWDFLQDSPQVNTLRVSSSRRLDYPKCSHPPSVITVLSNPIKPKEKVGLRLFAPGGNGYFASINPLCCTWNRRAGSNLG